MMSSVKAKDGFSIKTSFIIYATPDKVFEALTDTGIIAAWSGEIGVVENKAGGKFELFDGWVKGEVITFKPRKELSYTWKASEWSKNTPASIVKYTFKEHAAGTELFLEHTQLPSTEEADKHNSGWIDYVFEPLNDYFTSQL